VFPTLSAMELRKGWGTQIYGPIKIPNTSGAPPAQVHPRDAPPEKRLRIYLHLDECQA